jgi:hypothetical protein
LTFSPRPSEPIPTRGPAAAESRIIFNYGVRSIPRPWSLVREGKLDEHFGFPIVAMIEEAKDYFRTRLHTLLGAA